MPTTLTRIVRTGLSRTVSTPAIAAQWTMCVAPARAPSPRRGRERRPGGTSKFGCSASGVPDSASRWRLSSATISLSSTSLRASVVPMKPAPPVMKIRFPSTPYGERTPWRIASPASGRNRPHGRRRAAPAARDPARAELGLRVVAVDRNADAPGLAAADEGEVVDFTDVEAVTEAARRHRVDGVLTVSADRAVPVVAAVAEALGLPGIGAETAHADDAQDRDAAPVRGARRPPAGVRRAARG